MVFEQILQEIDRRKQKNRVFVIGITGIDASGETKFTESLAGFLLSLERNVQVIHLDHFHNPKKSGIQGKTRQRTISIVASTLRLLLTSCWFHWECIAVIR
jgi:uridine kinase